MNDYMQRPYGHMPIGTATDGKSAGDDTEAKNKAAKEKGKVDSNYPTKKKLAEKRARGIRIVSVLAGIVYGVVGVLWTFDWGYDKENIRILFISIPMMISAVLYLLAAAAPNYTSYDVGAKGGAGGWFLSKSKFLGPATLFTFFVTFFIGYAFYLGLFLPVYHEFNASDFGLFKNANGCDMMRCGFNERCVSQPQYSYGNPYEWNPAKFNVTSGQAVGEEDPDRITENVGCTCRKPGESLNGPGSNEIDALTHESGSIAGCIPEWQWNLETFQLFNGPSPEPKTNKARRGVFQRCSVFLCPRVTGANSDGSLKGELQHWGDSSRIENYRTLPLVMIIMYFLVPVVIFLFVLKEEKFKDKNLKDEIVLKKGAPMHLPAPAIHDMPRQHDDIGFGSMFDPILQSIPFVNHRTSSGHQLVDM